MLDAQTSTLSPGTATPAFSAPVLKLDALRGGLKELEEAYLVLTAAKAAWREKVKAIAEKSGLAPSVIRTYIAARCAEESAQADRKAEQAKQLALVFEEVGH